MICFRKLAFRPRPWPDSGSAYRITFELAVERARLGEPVRAIQDAPHAVDSNMLVERSR